MAHRRKREFLDDANQPSQASANHTQHLERDFRMSQAESLEVLLTDEEERGILDCGHGSRVGPSIEDWKLCDRTAWSIDAEYLLSSTSGTLEDADVSGLNDIESSARLALAENGFACGKMVRLAETGKQIRIP